MKFYVTGTRTRIVTTKIVEQIEGEISILKKEVVRVTGCDPVMDGDSTGWYEEVAEALECGAQHSTPGDSVLVEIDRNEQVTFEWDDVEVDW